MSEQFRTLAHYGEAVDFKRIASEQAFGIYRPLTTAATDNFGEIVLEAQTEAQDYLEKRRRAPAAYFRSRHAFGLTYLMRCRVKNAMSYGLLEEGFQPEIAVEEIANYAKNNTEEIVVALDELDWFDDYERQLGFKLDPHGSQDKQLATDAAVMQLCINRANGNALRVKKPDHLAFTKYGCFHDKMDLSSKHKNEVVKIFKEHFAVNNIMAVTVERPIVGNGYTEPHPLYFLEAA